MQIFRQSPSKQRRIKNSFFYSLRSHVKQDDFVKSPDYQQQFDEHAKIKGAFREAGHMDLNVRIIVLIKLGAIVIFHQLLEIMDVLESPFCFFFFSLKRFPKMNLASADKQTNMKRKDDRFAVLKSTLEPVNCMLCSFFSRDQVN